MMLASIFIYADSSILGLEFGCDYESVYNALSNRFGKSNVEKPDGEHIIVRNIDYTLDDVHINNIHCAFSYIDNSHHLCSIALTTVAMVLSYESDAEKIKAFNSYAVKQCNMLATKLHEKYAVSTVAKKLDTSSPWTVLYSFKVDENVSGHISAFFHAQKKLMMQTGSTFARIVYTDNRYMKNKLDEL